MKRIVTGLKPTGELTLGSYLGVIQGLVNIQDEYEIFLFVADLHAITTKQDRLLLRKLIKEFVALYIACGINPKNVKMFIQSEVKEHAQLGFILLCNTYLGELNRMTQYKDKALKGEEGLTGGFYTYPSLMAADILLYDADYVLVGNDQVQHLELTRDIAVRFNNAYGDTFKVPEVKTNKATARVKDLQNPLKKMSKSDTNTKGCILLTDDLNIIKKKIMSAVTDDEAKIYYDPSKPGIANLLEIYSALTHREINDIVNQYQDVTSYKTFKEDLATIVVDTIKPIQDKYFELLQSSKLDEVFDQARNEVSIIAKRKLKKVENKVGLGRK